MKRKCSEQSGFTMIEMLATVILVILFTEIMSLGIGFAVTTYADSIVGSEVQVLKAHLTTAINNELRFAGKVETDSGDVRIGENGKTFQLVETDIDRDGEKERILTFDEYDEEVDEEGNGRVFLISGSSYPENTQIKSFSISYDKEVHNLDGDALTEGLEDTIGIFTVKLEIEDTSSGEVIATNEFQVKNHQTENDLQDDDDDDDADDT